MDYFNSADDVRLAFVDDGPKSALPVLCLAGLTRDSRDFDYLAPHLADCRLIRMDYRGRGRSQWPADYHTYSIPAEAGDALALLDHLGLAKTAILGTSRGGLVAMAIAAMAHDRLLGVCLNDVGPVVSEAGVKVIETYLGRPLVFRTQAEFAAAKARRLTDFADVPARRWAEEAARQSVETETGLDLPYDPRLRDAFLEAAQSAAPPDLWPLFDAFAGLPVAILRAASSNILSAETSAEMIRRRPDAIFAEIPGRGHVPFLDEPASIAAIRAWLKACR